MSIAQIEPLFSPKRLLENFWISLSKVVLKFFPIFPSTNFTSLIFFPYAFTSNLWYPGEPIISLFKAIGKNLKLAIYNAGNNTPGKIIDMDSDYFRKCWEVLCLGGFIFGREALKIFSNKKMGTLICTGASASLRGKANFGAFNSGKAALRTLAQAMSKEYGPQGVHIGHIVIDGAIGGEKIWQKNPDYAKKLGKEGLINLDGIVESYVYLYNQPKEAWTFELDLRTSIEKW